MTSLRQATHCMPRMHRSVGKGELQMFKPNRTPAQAAARGPACEQSNYAALSGGMWELCSQAQIMAVSRSHVMSLL